MKSMLRLQIHAGPENGEMVGGSCTCARPWRYSVENYVKAIDDGTANKNGENRILTSAPHGVEFQIDQPHQRQMVELSAFDIWTMSSLS